VVGDGTYLTVGETVTALSGLMSEDTVRRMADRGEIRSIRMGARGDRRLVAADVYKLRDDMQAQISPPPVDDEAGPTA